MKLREILLLFVLGYTILWAIAAAFAPVVGY